MVDKLPATIEREALNNALARLTEALDILDDLSSHAPVNHQALRLAVSNAHTATAIARADLNQTRTLV